MKKLWFRLMSLFGEYPQGQGKVPRSKRSIVHRRFASALLILFILATVSYFAWEYYQSHKVTEFENFSIVGSPENYFQGEDVFDNIRVIDDYMATYECSQEHLDVKYIVPERGLNDVYNYDVSQQGEIGLLDVTAQDLPIEAFDMRWLLAHSATHACVGDEVFYEVTYEFAFEDKGEITGAFGLAFVITSPTGQQTFLYVISEAASDFLASNLLEIVAPEGTDFDPYGNIRIFLSTILGESASEIAHWNATSDPIALIAAVLHIEKSEVTAADINTVMTIFEAASTDPRRGLNLLDIYLDSGREWPYPDLPVPQSRER